MESRYYEEQCEIKTRAHEALKKMKSIETEKKLYEVRLDDNTIIRSNKKKRLEEYSKYLKRKRFSL